MDASKIGVAVMNWTAKHLTGPMYDIGAWTYGVPTVHWPDSGARLTIGRFVSIADGVEILLGGNHRTDWITTYPFPKIWRDAIGIDGHPATKGDIVIGSDVWIGLQAVILSGVAIGHGAVIGARAVVSKDVPPYAVACGNPAQVKNRRFDPDTIERLLAIAWWNWTDTEIRNAIPFLLSGNVETFIERYESKSEAR